METDCTPEKVTTEEKEPKEEPNYISFDDFLKVDLRVAQILEAQHVEKSEKLVRLKIDLEDAGGTRQLVAGIGKHYCSEELVGRKIVVVANLKPRKLMGLMSEGMLLAATDDSGTLELVNPGNAVRPGSRIS